MVSDHFSENYPLYRTNKVKRRKRKNKKALISI
jgi:hypothetical protein